MPAWESIPKLKAFIEQHAPLSINPSDISQGETRLATGLAVSPTMAMICANENMRTERFMVGLQQAIKQCLTANPDKVVHVFYAGCGPWATLALATLSDYSASQVQFTLLDIHPESLQSAQALIQNIGLSNGIQESIIGDASSYQFSKQNKPDIILSETINVTLGNEPQVAICRNLMLQVPDAIMIPQDICIELALINPSKEHVLLPSDHQGDIPSPQRERKKLGSIFHLNKKTIASWGKQDNGLLPANSIALPQDIKEHQEPRLLTTITVFKDITLTDYQCNLTLPTKLTLQHPLQLGQDLHFYYQLGMHPKLVAHQIIQKEKIATGLDRKQLNLSFDLHKLVQSLECFQENDWIDHYVPQNYEGTWQVIPLRSQKDATHPIQQINANADQGIFCDTHFLQRSPYLQKVLKTFHAPLLSVRLMKLSAGSKIKKHRDHDLSLEQGFVRLHIPIITNPQMAFYLNDQQLKMQVAECWYLRLSDPHELHNAGDCDRIHLVLDMEVNEKIRLMIQGS